VYTTLTRVKTVMMRALQRHVTLTVRLHNVVTEHSMQPLAKSVTIQAYQRHVMLTVHLLNAVMVL
jgi:hypothetical protein